MTKWTMGTARTKWLWRTASEGRPYIVALVCLLVLACSAFGQDHSVISGKIEDSSGAAIQGAQIEFRTEEGVIVASSDEQGQFRLAGSGKSGTLTVRFPGMAPATREIRARASTEHLQIVLAPAADLQRIEVRGDTTDLIPAVPTSQYNISAEAVDQSGSLPLDDVLRQVPGFSTFRRSSSFFANPTSQGVSLRGVGASATSRSLVLLDGIPLNDPFGAWVYWARIPREAIASMEVSNGGASDLYGGGALGGVVNLRTHTAEAAYGSLEMSYESLDTPDVSFAAGGVSDAGIHRGAGEPAWDGGQQCGFGNFVRARGDVPQSGRARAVFCARKRIRGFRKERDAVAAK
jgi:TonB-dependent Receptor Plug Domain/Carboxypeptidase regulatory-like domain